MRRVQIRPARLIPAAFLAAMAIGAGLLMLPISTASGEWASPVTALFTATSAVCITGLTVVDTGTYWSGFGQFVILALIQIGGFGILAGATLLGVLVSSRMRLAAHLAASSENRSLGLSDVRSVLRLVAILTLVSEAALAAYLTAVFLLRDEYELGQALWFGVFHSVSAFNNAGFGLWADNLMGFQSDIAVLFPVGIAVIVGGLGVPVLQDLRRAWSKPRLWSAHTKITLWGTLALLLAGAAATLVFEWSNSGTLGAMPPLEKIANALFHSAMTRTAGFNAVNIGEMENATLAASTGLMMIGGGGASTAGGIKVTTFFILGLVAWSEIRGDADVAAFGRRISSQVQRQALAVALISIAVVVVSTAAMMLLTPYKLEHMMFEVVSAFSNTGLSTGFTGVLPPSGQLLLVLLMFIGRVGPVSFAAALALRPRKREFRYPEEHPIVG
jgi:trk system potassium uptake protein